MNPTPKLSKVHIISTLVPYKNHTKFIDISQLISLISYHHEKHTHVSCHCSFGLFHFTRKLQ
jgi:hypothetical protein